MDKVTKYIMAATGTNTIIKQPNKSKPIKPFENSNFYSFTCAKQFWECYAFEDTEETYYLIEDLENDVYSVCDEEFFYHLQNEYNLHMKILYVS